MSPHCHTVGAGGVIVASWWPVHLAHRPVWGKSVLGISERKEPSSLGITYILRKLEGFFNFIVQGLTHAGQAVVNILKGSGSNFPLFIIQCFS